MVAKRQTLEQIIPKLREAEVALARGATVGQVCKKLGVAEQIISEWSDGGVEKASKCRRNSRNDDDCGWTRVLACGCVRHARTMFGAMTSCKQERTTVVLVEITEEWETEKVYLSMETK